MKTSRYTHISTDAGMQPDEAVIYNTASGNIAAIDQNLLINGGFDLGKLNSDQTEWLTALGFLVSDGVEEEAWQRSLFEQASNDRTVLNLCIAPTYTCNLRCPYCYEDGHSENKAFMSKEVIEAIETFVADYYREYNFNELNVQWYGGEPLLAPGVIEELSDFFIGFCEEHHIAYSSMAISNATRIDKTLAELLGRCRVSEIMITIDGDEAEHNKRRPAADGENSFQAIMGALEALRECGVNAMPVMNVDKVNALLFDQVHDELKARFGVELMPTKLNDYHGSFGSGCFKKGDFELFTFPAYAKWDVERLAESDPSREELQGRFSPFANFCKGQLQNYYCIDAVGDVYNCDGYMGQPELALFNLMRDDYRDSQPEIPNPADNEQCGDCDLLPVCQGNCHWERECCGMPCHPFKYVLDDYLRLYRNQFGPREDAIQLLA